MRIRGAGSARCIGVLLTLSLVVVVGCSSGDDEQADKPTTVPQRGVDGTPPAAKPLAETDRAKLTEQVGNGTCDELDTAHCLLPFPSDRFTSQDVSSDTGRRVALPTGQLANTSGATFDPTEWNRNDGFSPGSPMMTVLRDVDLKASKAPPLGDLGRSIDDDSPTVVVDLTTGERLAHWAELDADGAAGTRMLILRAAAGLPPGHEIGVALRGLKNTKGSAIEPTVAFRSYRDNLTTDVTSIEDRRGEMEELFGGLAEAGVVRSTLQLAWRFTVASDASIAGPMLVMRDDAFKRLGSAAPSFTVDQVIETDLPEGIGRRVTGTVEVPLYLEGVGEPGARLRRKADGEPVYAGSAFSAYFTCQIPTEAVEPDGDKARPVVYGHGLMGGAGEAENSQVAKNASTNNMAYCATDWIGMSGSDIGNVAAILQDISKFPSLPERSLQGVLNTLFMARAMKHPKGFASNAAFRNAAGEPVIDTKEVYFDGNSQGHILGGAATAVSQEWTRAVLGVGGMNYSLLLDRSVDFNSYFVLMRGAYPNRVDQLLIFGILQMLWDRGESNGYARHMTDDPYLNTPAHKILMHVGFGDHQVSMWAAEIQARTIGAKVRAPALAPGRHPDAKPFFGLEQVEAFPTDESLLVYWDSGTLPPPSDNITPAESPAFTLACGSLSADEQKTNKQCADSHEDPRREEAAIRQKDLFLRPNGEIQDTCDGEPCVADNRFTLDY